MRQILPGYPILQSMVLLGSFSLSLPLHAHVSVASSPAMANERAIVELSIPHGCTVDDVHLDTARVEVLVPESLTGLRPVFGALGNAHIETIATATGSSTRLIWEKPADTVLDDDTHYYSVKFRAQMPDAPFTQIALPTIQYCLNGDEEVSVAWDQAPAGGHDHNSSDTGGNPAPILMVYPTRHAGWNQYSTVVDQHLHDMSILDDAEIVWWNGAAYSSNPTIKAMIETDSSVTPLSEIHDGATFWVKY
ncbi:MAG: DUF1775 domain-containing protein [Gammaproteobacteria bacterium]